MSLWSFHSCTKCNILYIMILYNRIFFNISELPMIKLLDSSPHIDRGLGNKYCPNVRQRNSNSKPDKILKYNNYQLVRTRTFFFWLKFVQLNWQFFPVFSSKMIKNPADHFLFGSFYTPLFSATHNRAPMEAFFPTMTL